MESELSSLPVESAAKPIESSSLRVRRIARGAARYWFIILFGLMLATPALTQISGFDQVDPRAENRTLAPLPSPPRSLRDLVRYPAGLNAYLQDWFGLRQPMVRTNNWLRFTLFHEVISPDLLIGKHGRIFMTALPGNQHFSLINDVCGAGVKDGTFLGAAYSLTSLIEHVSRDFSHFTLLIVPGASILYSEDLPRWAWAPCRALKPSVERTLDDLKNRPDILAHVVYPIDALRDIKTRYLIIPKLNLHWAGDGPLRYAEFLSERRFGLQRTLDIPSRVDDWPSDLNRVNPGIAWVNRIPWPDPSAAGVSRCFGAACDPQADPAVIAPLDRYKAPNLNGKRLLIFGDSFADNISSDFTEYFGEVWHIHFNGLERLTRPQLDQLYELAFKEFHPDQFIYICNDFGIFYEPLLAQNFFWPTSRRQGRS